MTTIKKNTLRYPAEWEKQATTWIAFPHNKKNWYGERAIKIRKFYIKLIRTISEFQSVNILVPNQKFLTNDEKNAIANRTFPARIYEIKTDDIWIRDYGPFFIKKGSKTVICETIFNAWAGKFPPWKNDNLVPENIAKIFNYPIAQKVPHIFEGGAIEVNDDGLGITTLDCLIGKKRNKVKDLSKVIKALCKAFGLRSLLILPCGLNGDHTDGHIDNVARFVAKNRVVLASEENPKSKNHDTLTKAKLLVEAFLKEHYGKHAKVDTLPLPPQRTLPDGQILPASYMNYIYVNGGLIYPKYKCKNDKIAEDYFAKIYPNRKIIGIDCRTIIEEGGSLHCMSKHETE